VKRDVGLGFQRVDAAFDELDIRTLTALWRDAPHDMSPRLTAEQEQASQERSQETLDLDIAFHDAIPRYFDAVDTSQSTSKERGLSCVISYITALAILGASA
jgi:hypothetical protein